jgi:hypothetical protein
MTACPLVDGGPKRGSDQGSTPTAPRLSISRTNGSDSGCRRSRSLRALPGPLLAVPCSPSPARRPLLVVEPHPLSASPWLRVLSSPSGRMSLASRDAREDRLLTCRQWRRRRERARRQTVTTNCPHRHADSSARSVFARPLTGWRARQTKPSTHWFVEGLVVPDGELGRIDAGDPCSPSSTSAGSIPERRGTAKPPQGR